MKTWILKKDIPPKVARYKEAFKSEAKGPENHGELSDCFQDDPTEFEENQRVVETSTLK